MYIIKWPLANLISVEANGNIVWNATDVCHNLSMLAIISDSIGRQDTSGWNILVFEAWETHQEGFA